MKKKCLVLLILVGILFFTGCSVEMNKYDWNQAYSVEVADYPYYYSAEVEINVIHPTDEHGSINLFKRENLNIKKIYVKFDSKMCYIKIVDWNGIETIKDYHRENILYVDYI